MGSAPAVAGVARLPSIGDPSMRGEPKPRSPAATQPARTTVPHNAANAASRRGLISPPRFLSRPRPHPDHAAHPGTRRVVFFRSNYGHQRFGPKYGHARKENCRLSSFPKCVAGMQPDPGITVNGCGDAAIQPRCAEEAGLRALLLHLHDRAAARTRSTLWVSINAVPLCCGRPRSSAHLENHEVSLGSSASIPRCPRLVRSTPNIRRESGRRG